MEKGKKIVQTRQTKAKNNPPPWTVRGGWSMASPDSAPGQVRSAPRPWGLELPQSWPPNPRSATIFCIFLPCLIVFFCIFLLFFTALFAFFAFFAFSGALAGRGWLLGPCHHSLPARAPEKAKKAKKAKKTVKHNGKRPKNRPDKAKKCKK